MSGMPSHSGRGVWNLLRITVGEKDGGVGPWTAGPEGVNLTELEGVDISHDLSPVNSAA